MKKYIVYNGQLITSGVNIKLINMIDIQPIPNGTCGVVDFIDDIKQIHMRWDNGSSLAINIDLDEFEIINDNCIYHKLKLTKKELNEFLTPYGSSIYTPYKKEETINMILMACKDNKAGEYTFNTGSFTESGGGYGIDYEFILEENEEYAIIRKQVLNANTKQIETHIGLIKLA